MSGQQKHNSGTRPKTSPGGRLRLTRTAKTLTEVYLRWTSWVGVRELFGRTLEMCHKIRCMANRSIVGVGF